MGNCLCPCLKKDLQPSVKSIYEIKMDDIKQNLIDFNVYRNKVLLILAEKNFKQLVQLDSKFRSRGLEILGFPCNQFFWREYREARKIIEFTKKKGVTFKIFDHVEVNGDNTCDLYKLLRKYSKLDSSQIGLNFGKFLVDRNGRVFDYYGPLTNPVEIEEDIEKLL